MQSSQVKAEWLSTGVPGDLPLPLPTVPGLTPPSQPTQAPPDPQLASREVLLPPHGSASPFPYTALGSRLEMVRCEPLRWPLIFAGSLPRCQAQARGEAHGGGRRERARDFRLPKGKKKKRGSEAEGGTCGWAASARASPGGIRRAALVPGFQGHFSPVCRLLERSHRRGCWRGTARCRAALSGKRQEGQGEEGRTVPPSACVPSSPGGRPPSVCGGGLCVPPPPGNACRRGPTPGSRG